MPRVDKSLGVLFSRYYLGAAQRRLSEGGHNAQPTGLRERVQSPSPSRAECSSRRFLFFARRTPHRTLHLQAAAPSTLRAQLTLSSAWEARAQVSWVQALWTSLWPPPWSVVVREKRCKNQYQGAARAASQRGWQGTCLIFVAGGAGAAWVTTRLKGRGTE